MSNLLITNGKIVDVETKTIIEGNLLIQDEIIAQINPTADQIPRNCPSYDAGRKYIVPGFIETHLHIESSMMPPLQFCNIAIQKGTTTLMVDPHEITNVAGVNAIKTWIDQAHQVPTDLYVAIPSCVPATHMEHSGATIGLPEISELISDDHIYGLGEMMNFPGIVHDIGDARAKVDLVFKTGKIVDGHCPGLRGDDLKTYISNGHLDGVVRIMNDHESTSVEEVIEKLENKMYIALRYGSASKDLDQILPGLLQKGINLDHCTLCSDDLSPNELHTSGHIDRVIRQTAKIFRDTQGLSPDKAMIEAISLATYTSGHYIARFLSLTQRPPIGQIKAGYKANLVFLDELDSLHITDVMYAGKFILEDVTNREKKLDYDYGQLLQTVNIGRDITADDFKIAAPADRESVQVNVIGSTGANLITEKRVLTFPVHKQAGEAFITGDVNQDISKIAVFERHHDTGHYSVGFIQGLNLKSGALASTVAHDNHNLIVMGNSDEEMAALVNFMHKEGGGMATLYKGEITHFPLQIGGLMALDPIDQIIEQYSKVKTVAKTMGTSAENIFMTLSFMALAVIPSLKITDVGLIDVDAFQPIDLILP